MSRPLDELPEDAYCVDADAERLEPRRGAARALVAALAVAATLVAVAVVSDAVLTPPEPTGSVTQ